MAAQPNPREIVWAQLQNLTIESIALKQILIAKGVLMPGELEAAVKATWATQPREKRKRFAGLLGSARQLVHRVTG